MNKHYEPEQIADRLRLIADLIERHGITTPPTLSLRGPHFDSDVDQVTPLMVDLGDLTVNISSYFDYLRSDGAVDVRVSYGPGRLSTEREVTSTERVPMTVDEITAQVTPPMTRGEREAAVIETVES